MHIHHERVVTDPQVGLCRYLTDSLGRHGLPIVFGVLILAGCRASSDDHTGTAANEFINLDPSVGYVGRNECGRCHRDKLDTYVHAEMGRSFKKATIDNSVADFENARPVYDPFRNLFYQAFHRGQELFIREYRLEDGDTTYQRVEKIDFIVGSGQHTNSHIMEVNGYLFQMPLTWYVQEGKWDLPPGFEGGVNRRFDRMIEIECMSCHNATPGYVENSGNRYDFVPEGIDCERCHGPGEAHVKAMESGKVVDVKKKVDRTIVNPSKLDTDLQFDVCQRCHLQGTAVTVEGKSFLDFRPGMRLGDVLKVFQPRYSDSLSQFIMASHPDRLRMSACFIQSRASAGDGADAESATAAMTCVTCHNPHVSINEMPPDSYRTACLSCHERQEVADCTEDIGVRRAKDDQCAACHMPVSGSKDIPHVRITDHYIRVPGRVNREAVERQKEFVQLASLSDSSPTPEVMASGYLAHYEQFEHRRQFLDSAAVYLERALEHRSRAQLAQPLVRLWFLQGDYRSVASLADSVPVDSLGDGWTLYRIGESYAKLGNVRLSIRYFERAVAGAPDHLQFRTKLATAYAADRQLERAIELFSNVIRDNPKWSEAYNNRGFAYALQGDFAQAEKDFKRSIELNPDFEQALGNLASLYANTSRPEKARVYLKRLMKLDPGNTNYQRLFDLL